MVQDFTMFTSTLHRFKQTARKRAKERTHAHKHNREVFFCSPVFTSTNTHTHTLYQTSAGTVLIPNTIFTVMVFKHFPAPQDSCFRFRLGCFSSGRPTDAALRLNINLSQTKPLLGAI